MVLGNHEDRINRVSREDPTMEGRICIDDLMFREYGWEVHKYKSVAVIEGWHFSHYFASGVMGRPIGGENAARLCLNKKHVSCVFGHSHLLSIAESTRADGQKITCLNVGCFSHPHQVEGWNASTAGMWWNGVVMIEGAHDGQYKALHFIREDSIR
jgi:hypothetical protein